jgi:hypothetical protein
VRVRAGVDRQRRATYGHALSGDGDGVARSEACRGGEPVFEHRAFPTVQPVPGGHQGLVDRGRAGVADVHLEADRRAADIGVDLRSSPRATGGDHPRCVAEAGQLGTQLLALGRRHVRRDLRIRLDVEAVRGL